MHTQTNTTYMLDFFYRKCDFSFFAYLPLIILHKFHMPKKSK